MEPSPVCFQRVSGENTGAVSALRLAGVHLMYLQYATTTVQVRDIQGNRRVLHPEFANPLAAIDKQHAMIDRKTLAQR